MHIAHILGYLASHYGGPPQVAINLGRTLKQHQLSVSWWATATAAEQDELAYLGNDARLFHSQFLKPWSYSSALRSTLQAESSKIDIFHLHQVWDYPLQAAASISHKAGKPHLITPHGIFTQPWRYKTPKKQLYLKMFESPMLKQASCIHAIAPNELDGFKQAGLEAPYTVIPNGINPEEFAELPDPKIAEQQWDILRDRTVVLFLGRLSPEKGLDPLIQAWRNVIDLEPNALLMLAGPNFQGYGDKLEALVNSLALNNSVLFPGKLQGASKLAALSRADLFVLPSYSEGFSIAILEALASSKPCVITKNCNFPDVAKSEAGIIVETDATQLSEALLQLIRCSKAERLAMGARGKKLVLEHYTWEIVTRKMLTVYHCLAENKPVPLYPEPITDVKRQR
jgi:glycosyltransferase involved in cell wall biosynthesis